MDVDRALKGASIALLQPFEPEDPGNDRVATQGIHSDNFARWLAILELHPKRRATADLLGDLEASQRRSIAARPITETKLRGGDAIDGDRGSPLEHHHLLICHTDSQHVVAVASAGTEKHGDSGEVEESKTHAGSYSKIVARKVWRSKDVSPASKCPRRNWRMGIHVLQRRQTVPIPLDECWAFFSNPRNLPQITPPALGFEVLSELPDTMHAGLMIQYRVRPLIGVPLRWLTEITHVDPLSYFVDEQRVGPYRVWHHEHWFKAIDATHTEATDIVHYVLPFGPLGYIVEAVLVRSELRKIFDFREKVVAQRFAA